MRHQQSYQKTKTRFMRELLAQLVKQHIEMRYQNKKSMHKLNKPSSATDCPKIINVTDITYKTIKSIKMPRAVMSKSTQNSCHSSSCTGIKYDETSSVSS
ncbi:hypothetical protein T12_2882 [Trichinella patagoniensis]|uniref:Uncharacterized protein n=1 Tax=Trichinella patagoniensis TaxID=990121 RepID=A0A0V0ZIT4_9BILA|nr:hypothetical protein T12_2882 [Trichinella patagoniensis]